LKITWHRFRPAFFIFIIIMVGDFLTRIMLLLSFASGKMLKPSLIAKVFITGLRMDLATTSWILLPFIFWLLFIPQTSLNKKWHRYVYLVFSIIFFFMTIFGWIAEYFFFEEFHSRFNTVAVDYILYPYEVFVNVWQSYPVIPALLFCLVLSLLCTFLIRKALNRTLAEPNTFSSRALAFLVLIGFFTLFTQTTDNATTRFSGDRNIDEISNNGLYSLAFAASTRQLDYEAFYLAPEKNQVYPAARAVLKEPTSQFVDSNSTLREFVADANRKKLNVVVMLEESFGSEFWGVLGNKEGLTPEMDSLSREGILFTNLYASGNRTVRGMEGVLASFPPLPGDSIVKRHLSDHIETLARVLKRDGYATSFMYGGRGVFDGMRSFVVRNGYDEFIEQKDFENPGFATVWGVSDEDLFYNGVKHLKKLRAKGQPYFVTFLSVSNHKPYTYPKNRIKENPDEERRDFAVKYSDWALGRFFELAKKEDVYKDTIFVVIADHGARVYGSQKIPAHSYEIPMVILGPPNIVKPQKFAGLGCSLDVAPTIMGLLGRPYQSVFFGRDLLHGDPREGRVLINHNRDIGIYKAPWLAVFGINKTLDFYKFNPATHDFDSEKNITPEATQIAKEGQALFSAADDLYMNQKYFIPEKK
jgi:phosphoglycerol transferase MdoB-like AlkP superfamily enzyme